MVERYNIVRERKSAYEYHHTYSLDTKSLCDVYAFNMPINDRGNNPQEYRFGFNGMEKDPEITGQEGSHYTAPFWEYDTRIARRWNVDPVTYPWQSSYAVFNDNPILYTDPDGRYGKKSQADNEREKMVDELDSSDRVGEVYNFNEGTDKEEDWGFVVYKDKEGDKKEVEAYIFNKDELTSFEKYHLGKRSKIAKGLEKADEFSRDYIAPIAMKVLPPTAVVDAATTMISGSDLLGNEAENGFERFVLPGITIGTIGIGVADELTRFGFTTIKLTKYKMLKQKLVVRNKVVSTPKINPKVSGISSGMNKGSTIKTVYDEVASKKDETVF